MCSLLNHKLEKKRNKMYLSTTSPSSFRATRKKNAESKLRPTTSRAARGQWRRHSWGLAATPAAAAMPSSTSLNRRIINLRFVSKQTYFTF